MKNKTKQVGVILHGEAMIFPSKLPKKVTKIETTNSQYHIIADSETTGNHHVVDLNDGVTFFKNEGGTMFAVCEKPTQVRCILENRHSTIPLPAGTYEFGIQQEYDHMEQHMRNVKD